jgi:hypothetical protein
MWISAALLIRYVILSREFHHLLPQFSHPLNGNINYSLGCFEEKTHVYSLSLYSTVHHRLWKFLNILIIIVLIICHHRHHLTPESISKYSRKYKLFTSLSPIPDEEAEFLPPADTHSHRRPPIFYRPPRVLPTLLPPVHITSHQALKMQ